MISRVALLCVLCLPAVAALWAHLPQRMQVEARSFAADDRDRMDREQRARLELPLMKRMDLPLMKKMDLPLMKRMDLPLMKKMDLPLMKRMDLPLMKKMDLPLMKKMDLPLMKRTSTSMLRLMRLTKRPSLEEDATLPIMRRNTGLWTGMNMVVPLDHMDAGNVYGGRWD